MTRRDFLQQSSALASAAALAGCAHPAAHPGAPFTAPSRNEWDEQTSTPPGSPPALPFYDRVPPLAPIRAEPDRLFKITVCTRPFRPQGPRIEAERLGDKLIVHNYGHGGSGWSLSWGSGTLALDLAFSGRDPATTDIAVIGCGALGLTAAILAQRAGARSVTIYARDRPSETRSSNATGSWTPDSRIALVSAAPASFASRWETMTRTSWHYYHSFLGLPGNPVEFNDRYFLSDPHPDEHENQQALDNPLGFATYHHGVPELFPVAEDLPPGSHPFPTKWARRRSDLMFNITSYSHLLTENFHLDGGRIVTREFHSPAELLQLPQPVILHCTGYAARTLFSDNSLVPVRGQIGWLIPQPECNYGLYFDDLNILTRRDGIVVQSNPLGDATGYNDPSEVPDHAAAVASVQKLQHLYTRMAAMHP